MDHNYFSAAENFHIIVIVLLTFIFLTVLIWAWCGIVSSINPVYTFHVWWNELMLGRFPVESEILRYSKTKLRERSVRLEIERALRQKVITPVQAEAWKKQILEVCPSYTRYRKGKFSFSDYAKIQEAFDNIVLSIWDKSM
ncbi:MAG: hypothetical protein J6P00_04865 [Acetobacter sp.]|nr:hypothetical protein [Acetobacter sp.]MBO6091530.1 hypothetical protein [Acetobacter sp.]MBO7072109.1 hypothetical protein [Acetobacter sp.]MBO7350213.1 hypothetical protein [Acetobacter sp.]MBQ3817722.1 hypothetical protein [Acetobacter sp.]